LKDEGKWLQIADDEGHWLYYSSRGAVGSMSPPPPNTSGQIVPFVTTRKHSLRTLTRDIDIHARRYHVAMAISSDMSGQILVRFGRDLWLLVPAVLLVAAAVGHSLSRRALNPVRAIVTEVRHIHDRNLSKRLSVSSANDELSQLSETLNQMLERIDVAFRSVRSLTANASHELRTPLSLIRTRVEIALCFPRNADEYREVLEEVQLETVRMTALIENLLMLARADASAVQPELSPVDMTELIHKAEREWTPTAARLDLTFQIQKASCPQKVLGSKEALERLIRMLLDNAFTYTPAGGHIQLGVDRHEGHVELWVRDDGIGIAEQDIPRIFERFYRAAKPQSMKQTGSGLGLSLAKWIADLHEASITVESAIGTGSCFRVTFLEYAPADHSSPMSTQS
jgi:heavy metal sensor kinase